MKIELLYFDGCPHHQKAYELLQAILGENKITDPIQREEIKDDEEALLYKFIGSPTIRVDDVDIETITEDRPYAKTCRVYFVNGKMSGIPSKTMIQAALWRVNSERGTTR